MPRKIRRTVNLPSSQDAQLVKLSKDFGCSFAEMTRKAIALGCLMLDQGPTAKIVIEKDGEKAIVVLQ